MSVAPAGAGSGAWRRPSPDTSSGPAKPVLAAAPSSTSPRWHPGRGCRAGRPGAREPASSPAVGTAPSPPAGTAPHTAASPLASARPSVPGASAHAVLQRSGDAWTPTSAPVSAPKRFGTGLRDVHGRGPALPRDGTARPGSARLGTARHGRPRHRSPGPGRGRHSPATAAWGHPARGTRNTRTVPSAAPAALGGHGRARTRPRRSQNAARGRINHSPAARPCPHPCPPPPGQLGVQVHGRAGPMPSRGCHHHPHPIIPSLSLPRPCPCHVLVPAVPPVWTLRSIPAPLPWLCRRGRVGVSLPGQAPPG